MNNKIKKTISILLIAATVALVSGCMTTNPYTGEQSLNDSSIGTGIGAVGGAILGGIVGGRSGVLIGAAAGGLAGGLIGHAMDNVDSDLRQRLVGTGVQVTKVGNSVQLRMASDVTFRTDSDEINGVYYNTLTSVAIVLKKYKRTNIVISGFTDSTGAPSHNQDLSERRAASVGSFLTSQGINSGRILTRGFGKRYPIATNVTAQGRAMNRRVVITLTPM